MTTQITDVGVIWGLEGAAGALVSTFCFLIAGAADFVAWLAVLVSLSGVYSTGLLQITALATIVLDGCGGAEMNAEDDAVGRTPALWSWGGKNKVDEGGVTIAAKLAGGAGGLGRVLNWEGWKEVEPIEDLDAAGKPGPVLLEISASNLPPETEIKLQIPPKYNPNDYLPFHFILHLPVSSHGEFVVKWNFFKTIATRSTCDLQSTTTSWPTRAALPYLTSRKFLERFL